MNLTPGPGRPLSISIPWNFSYGLTSQAPSQPVQDVAAEETLDDAPVRAVKHPPIRSRYKDAIENLIRAAQLCDKGDLIPRDRIRELSGDNPAVVRQARIILEKHYVQILRPVRKKGEEGYRVATEHDILNMLETERRKDNIAAGRNVRLASQAAENLYSDVERRRALAFKMSYGMQQKLTDETVLASMQADMREPRVAQDNVTTLLQECGFL